MPHVPGYPRVTQTGSPLWHRDRKIQRTAWQFPRFGGQCQLPAPDPVAGKQWPGCLAKSGDSIPGVPVYVGDAPHAARSGQGCISPGFSRENDVASSASPEYRIPPLSSRHVCTHTRRVTRSILKSGVLKPGSPPGLLKPESITSSHP